ncbi:uncharacterized protein LOC144928731 [Branchiostoma floridae x Branchiostoma belcheri]
MTGKCSLALVIMVILVGLLTDQPGVLSAPAEPDLDGNFRNAQHEFMTNLNTLRQTMAAFKDVLSTLQKRVPTLDSRLLTLEGRFKEREERLNHLEDTMDTDVLDNRVLVLESSVNQSKERLDHMENTMDSAILDSRVLALESSVNESKERLDHMENTMDADILDSRVHALESSVNESKERLDQMENTMDADILDSRVLALESSVNESKERLDHMENTMDPAIQALEERQDSLELVLDTTNENLEAALEAIDESGDTQNVPSSCSEVAETVGIDTQAFYLIDPDGPGSGVLPMVVKCDREGQTVVTLLGHNSETRTYVHEFENPGSYSKDVVYWNSMEQVRALVDRSSHCKQYIKYECYKSVIWESTSRPYAWWVTWDGRQADYWGGAQRWSHKCECGRWRRCSRCNCDYNDGRWRADSGYLSYKTDLPVTQLRFGDTSGSEKGYHTLGKLKCYP